MAKLQAVAAQKRLEEELKLRAKKERASKKKDQKKEIAGSAREEVEEEPKEKEEDFEEDTGPTLFTEFDRKNDLKSLYRKLNDKLYLLVKRPRKVNAWEFPQGVWTEPDGDHLKNTAVRHLQEQGGSSLKFWVVGNAPIGYHSYAYTPEAAKKYGVDSARVFFYKTYYLHGKIKFPKDMLLDHIWVTADEMKDYLPEGYYKAVREIIY